MDFKKLNPKYWGTKNSKPGQEKELRGMPTESKGHERSDNSKTLTQMIHTPVDLARSAWETAPESSPIHSQITQLLPTSGGSGNGMTNAPHANAATQLFPNAQGFHIETMAVITQPSQEGKTKAIDIKALSEWVFKGPSYRQYHQQLQSRRVDGTGLWFTESNEFKKWLSGTHRVLWTTGKPGAGKSFLACMTIDYLRSRAEAEGSGNPVLGVYCRYNAQLSSRDILRSLIWQLLTEHEVVRPVVEEEFKKHAVHGEELLQSTAVNLLTRLTMLFDQVQIVVDGLDELEDEDQVALLEAFAAIPAQIIIISRPLVLCLDYIPSAITLSIEARNEDIERFVKTKIDSDPKLRRNIGSKPTLLQEVVEKVKTKANGMFLVAALQVEALKGCATQKTIRNALDTFPSAVDLMYEETLKRIDNQSEEESKIARLALLWVAHAGRPLRLHQLCDAVATVYVPGSFEIGEYDRESIPEDDTILSVCCGLLVVDNLFKTVTLIHETAKRFIVNHPSAPFKDSAEIAMMTTITQCLNPGSTYVPMTDSLIDVPFYDYACTDWFYHAKAYAASLDPKREVDDVLSDLCTKWNLPHPHINFPPVDHDGDGVSSQASPNRPKACLFLTKLAKTRNRVFLWFLHKPSPILHGTITKEAVRSGPSALKIIVQVPGFDPDAGADIWGTTPLIRSIKLRYIEAVGFLVQDVRVDLNAVDRDWMTALHHACECLEEKLVETLLADRRINVNCRNKDGATPLMLAAQHRSPEVANVLLQDGRVDVNLADAEGTTALHHACRRDRDELVEILLADSRTDVNCRNNDGRTPLMMALILGSFKAVELLLQDDRVDVTAVDRVGMTAFHWACGCRWHKHEIVRQILANPLTDVNHQWDTDSWSPLMVAAYGGCPDSVAAVLDRPGVKVNLKGKQGTALCIAARDGYVDVVKALLVHPGVELNIPDVEGYTPFLQAVRWGHTNVLEVLLADERVDTGVCNIHGQTALSIAAQWAHLDIAKVLLQRGLNLNTRDNEGRTPLMHAQENLSLQLSELDQEENEGEDSGSEDSVSDGGEPSPTTDQLRQDLIRRHHSVINFILSQPGIDTTGFTPVIFPTFS